MAMVEDRKKLLRRIEEERSSTALLYVTGDRPGWEARIGNDVIDLFVDHLDAVGPVNKLSLILYTRGGETAAAWNLVNLLRMFCEELEVIVPAKCMSAGTLISLGANRIVMTKQATLGPIDPSLQHSLAPQIPGANPDARASVSVEAVNGYLDATGTSDSELYGKALLDLSDKVHPLVLGQIFRSRQQIRDLAERLLKANKRDGDKIQAIIDFLCSESGSHDYTINRREASSLGLDVEKPSDEFYKLLKSLHDSYSEELSLRVPFDLNMIAVPGQSTNYQCVRAMIESVKLGAHHFVTEGEMLATQIQQPQPVGPPVLQIAVQDRRKFDEWRKMT